MEKLFALKDVYSLYEGNQLLVLVGIMIFAFYPLLFITKSLIFPGVHKIATLKGNNYDEIINKHRLTSRLIHLFIALYLMFWGDIFGKSKLVSEAVLRGKYFFVTLYLIFAITTFFLALVNIGGDIYKTKEATVYKYT